jgi:serine/threonine protein kinase
VELDLSKAPGARIGLELDGPSGERFTLTEFIGQGAFGEVYRAIGGTTGACLAVKLLPLGGVSDEAKHALINEMKLATQIVHDNVVKVVYAQDDSSSGSGPYMMMEFIPGDTLEGILSSIRAANSQIPLDEAREMMGDIAQGARAINEKLIHRDLKPDNIVHDGSRLKITDFGISKIVGDRTRTHTFKGIGAIRYLAPEGWEYEKNTFKIDVYAAGLIFYEILTLQHPLEGKVADKFDWRAWEKVHRYSDCPDVRKLRGGVDTALAQLLERMTAKRAAERPDWVEVLKYVEGQKPAGAEHNPISGAVEIALRILREKRELALKEKDAKDKAAQKTAAYEYSIKKLMGLFDDLVENFNAEFQPGKIFRTPSPAGYRFRYDLPVGGSIDFAFFPRQGIPVRSREGQLSGGAYIATDRGLSANLILLTDTEDEYGEWKGVLFDFNAMFDARSVATKSGLTHLKKVPFGFERADQFYEQAQQTFGGGIHVFTCQIRSDIRQFLTDLLETALVEQES